MGKVVTQEELKGIVAQLKSQGKKIVTTNGSFDILHVGHVRALQLTRALGDVLIIGVNSDSSVKQYKSDQRPIIPQDDRAEMLAALACVDYVTIFTETDPRNFLELVKPNVHCKSGDYDAEKMIETPVVRKNGGEVKIIPFVPGKSTTAIVKKICDVYGQNAG
jgi:rfaE bifunctional protein nucleotidyltransferase chain/domain